MIYADFESIVVPEDHRKQIQMSLIPANIKNIAYSYVYKLVCVDDKFSKSFELYLDEMLLTILLAV